VHVVSKCDKPDANRTIADLKGMLALGLSMAPPPAPGRERWVAPVVATASLRDEGIGELAAAIDRHHRFLDTSGEIDARRKAINERRMLKACEEILRREFERHQNAKVSGLLQQIDARSLSPHAAAGTLLAQMHIEMHSGDNG